MKLSLAGFDLTVSTALWAAVAVIMTAIATRYVGRAIKRVAQHMNGIADDLALQAARIARYFVIVIGAGIVLAILGAPIQPVVAATLLVLAAAFLVVRGIADNFGAGLMIQARHPIRLGDLVGSSGYLGHVVDLNARSVVLVTLDGTTVHLPNRGVLESPLVNYSLRPRVRSQVQIRVDSGGLDQVPDILVETTDAVRGVLSAPRPQVLMIAADPDQATFTLRFWHEPDSGPLVSSRVATATYLAMVRAGRTTAVSWPPPAPPIQLSTSLGHLDLADLHTESSPLPGDRSSP